LWMVRQSSLAPTERSPGKTQDADRLRLAGAHFEARLWVHHSMPFAMKAKLKQLAFLTLRMGGERTRAHCNVCDTKDVIFCSNAWVRAGVCSKCRSESRHRIVAAAPQHHHELNYYNLLYKKQVIHIAPEPALPQHCTTRPETLLHREGGKTNRPLEYASIHRE
jgi:hypothetical protein